MSSVGEVRLSAQREEEGRGAPGLRSEENTGRPQWGRVLIRDVELSCQAPCRACLTLVAVCFRGDRLAQPRFSSAAGWKCGRGGIQSRRRRINKSQRRLPVIGIKLCQASAMAGDRQWTKGSDGLWRVGPLKREVET